MASITNRYPSQEIIDSKIPIVDIRTEGEWKETGIIKNAITIVFFNEKGSYDVRNFLTKLNQKVDTKKPFALICRTGSRTTMVSDFLSKQLNYDVVNLKGGMMYLKSLKLPSVIVPYKK
ncbi:MAG: rhodanese-like domain-containing protein [Epsilonproteobacteria bacterium]|nr:rhodanese-like domain-containing protein [Campylobacterota bacterium]